MRRVIIAESLFLDIATTEERQKVNEFYKNKQKGLAISFMMKRIRDHWVYLINKDYKEVACPSVKRFIKINYKGVSQYQSI